jgi:aconitate hydratase
MVRGAFSNSRLRNRLVERPGGWTEHMPSGDEVTVYEAAVRYRAEGTPLIILAGRDYGIGSSRDWAAKGTRLLGIRVVLAESFERIHRENLVCLGVLPLAFPDGESAASLGLSGRERFTITPEGGGSSLAPHQLFTVVAEDGTGGARTFRAIAQVENGREAALIRSGGIMAGALRQLLPDRPSPLAVASS